jgi:polar amino acid transport system substrate-binding protein
MKCKLMFALFIAWLMTQQPLWAAESSIRIPNFIGEPELSNRNVGSGVRTLRFLTTLDFPPFSYLDENGRLTGFNVYLAKSICAELGIQAACTIQALPFDELVTSINAGRGDAIISGLAANALAREQLSFSNSYLRFPGRFVMTKSVKPPLDFDAGLIGEKIGVIAGSGHEKLARSYFPKATVIGIASEQLLYEALRANEVDNLFGDGLNLSFWVNGQASKGCCELVGGAYYSSAFLGEGMRIATLNSRPDVIEAINKAFNAIQQKQGIEELFLRFFPNSFY